MGRSWLLHMPHRRLYEVLRGVTECHEECEKDAPRISLHCWVQATGTDDRREIVHISVQK